jgi:DNA modification methylase
MPTSTIKLRPIHPFPARMAPSIALRRLSGKRKALQVLDPMVGSGTTAVAARLRGHQAIGFDTDPLALLIAKSWAADIDPNHLRQKAVRVLEMARKKYRELAYGSAYPNAADAETKAFIRFWFDLTNRRQLTALAHYISQIRQPADRTLLWCAFSRLIITKKVGVSLAMDVSHSRPHKKYDLAPVRPFDRFLSSVEAILRNTPFSSVRKAPAAKIRKGDARKLPLDDSSIDLVITSPPYLNAIDYLRGHKLSLVWMEHWIQDLRELRSKNVGTECPLSSDLSDDLKRALGRMGNITRLPERIQNILKQYIRDMDRVFSEIARVLRDNGEAVVVIGDSTIKGIFIRNSWALVSIAKKNGLSMRSSRRRPLLQNRRYLPPPDHEISGKKLGARMREEVILVFAKKGKSRRDDPGERGTLVKGQAEQKLTC